MDDDQLAAKIRADCVYTDVEQGHVAADELVIAKLRELGFVKTADAWEAVPKWYA